MLAFFLFVVCFFCLLFTVDSGCYYTAVYYLCCYVFDLCGCLGLWLVLVGLSVADLFVCV